MNLPLILLFGVFVVLLLLGAPTYLALLAGGLSYFFLHPEIDAMAVCQKKSVQVICRRHLLVSKP